MNFVSIIDDNKLSVNFECSNLKRGVSGLMRVRNDADFVALAIDSCINFLDELIIVYNDCTDDTPNIIFKKASQYPDKIRVYEYPYKIYAVNLSKQEFDYVNSLPLDSPHRLCNYYNFALSKVHFKCAMKIDADQLYFSNKLLEWNNIYTRKVVSKLSFSAIIGIPLIYWVAYNIRKGHNSYKCSYLKFFSTEFFSKCYYNGLKYWANRKNVCLSLSGLNIFKSTRIYVPLGGGLGDYNLLPPYNGTGDHLLFTVDKKCYYLPADLEANIAYSKQTSSRYSAIERFNKNALSFCVGISWFHLNCMRRGLYQKILRLRDDYPEHFTELSVFNKFNYYDDISRILSSKYPKLSNLYQFLTVYKDVDYQEEATLLKNFN